ncbi:hypothetical protein ABZW11_11645 [Nonomuraea sp. NPDC004580]
MGYVLNLQEMTRNGAPADDAALSISTNSWFACLSSASQIFCITT